MATKNLKALMLGTVEKSAAEKAAQDKNDAQAAQAPAAPAPSPAAMKPRLVEQVRENLKPTKTVGKIDTVTAVDPAAKKFLLVGQQLGKNTKPVTVKLDTRLIQIMQGVCGGQNFQSVMSHLVLRGIVAALDEVGDGRGYTHVMSKDRDSFMGVEDERILGMVRFVEENAGDDDQA